MAFPYDLRRCAAPAVVSLGVDTPQNGGNTHFADQRAALASLPGDLCQRIDGLSTKHNPAHDNVGNLRLGFEAFDDPRDASGAVHKIARKHDETGDACLHLGRRE